MNQILVELAEQATSKISVHHEGYRGRGYTELVECFDKEKFAESIVTECAELLERQCTWLTNIAASKLIRTHFGVE